MAWTDEKRELAVELYTAQMDVIDGDDAKAERSVEVTASVAEEIEESVNGTRMVLSKAGVYVKAQPKKAATKAASGAASPRVNKAEAIQKLTNLISAIDPDMVEEDILNKLTGKAALYFATILELSTQQD